MKTQLKSKIETERNSKSDLKLTAYAIVVVSIVALFALILRFGFHLV